MELYPHQKKMVEDARKALKEKRRIVLTGPPGIGKTKIAKHIFFEKLNNHPGRILFCVHRRGLVDNASDSFNELPVLEHGTIMSGKETSFHYWLQVASIDTLLAWWIKPSEKTYRGYSFDLIVFDECHSHCQKLRKFLEYHDQFRKAEGKPEAYVLGLSATPQGSGVGDVFRKIVSGPRIDWLTDNGYLKRFEYYGGRQADLKVLKKSGREFTKTSVIKSTTGLQGEFIRDWKKLGQGRPTVGFFPSRAQAKEAQQMLMKEGVAADYIDGNTPDDERKLAFRFLETGDTEYLANVAVVERGSDIPCVSCVQLCLPVGSIVRYRQMIGRGSRPHHTWSDCIVLDHGGNVHRHGFFTDEVKWDLETSVWESFEHKEKAEYECPECSRIYRGGKCSCGYEPPVKELKAKGLEFDGSQLKKITSRNLKPISNNDIMVRALYIAANKRLRARQAVGIAFGIAKSYNVQFQVPKEIRIAGNLHRVPFGNELVSEVFPWMLK